MKPAIRAALTTDINRLVELCEQANHTTESYTDSFYATGPNYPEQIRESIAKRLEAPDAIAFVHETASGIDGAILGRLVNAPPVYDPGGKVCLIDNFPVATSSGWADVAKELVQVSKERIAHLGGVLCCIECRHPDSAKRELLLSMGYSVASDWYYRDTNLPPLATHSMAEIDVAGVADVRDIVDLCEERRLQYQRYQPVFWRKARDSAERQTPYIESLVASGAQTVLVHRAAGKVDGMITADLRAVDPMYEHRGIWCSTDDFAVKTEDTWASIGASLLSRAIMEAKSKGAVFTQVVCGHADMAKSRMLLDLGYRVGHEWLVRSV